MKVLSAKRRNNALYGSLQRALATWQESFCGESVVRATAQALYKSLDTPVARRCLHLLDDGDLPTLVSLKVNPLDYTDWTVFRDDYLAVSFLKKVPFVCEGLDPEAKARESFWQSERECLETNRRFRGRVDLPPGIDTRVGQVLMLAREKIHGVLGKFSTKEWLNSCRFGPGGFNHPQVSGLTAVYDKLQVRPSSTPEFGNAARMLIQSSPAWARSVMDVEMDGYHPFVDRFAIDIALGNRVSFVPKTALTHRPIGVEPLMNLYAQLGIGTMIRRRLKRIGINLDSQYRNQRLARFGSRTGLLATIDLERASDTIAKHLVIWFLSHPAFEAEGVVDWLSAMSSCRSRQGELDSTLFTYEKFSSMGNGFTFELESLIFWALSSSACELSTFGRPTKAVSVFGDDIIVPVQAYDLLVDALNVCGFTVNSAKSFSKGPFRESCGKDFYEGNEVRPFFQKEIPQDLEGVFKLANGLRRLAHRRNRGFGCDQRLQAAHRTSLRSLPRIVRDLVVVPASAGDTYGIVTDWDTAQRSPWVLRPSSGKSTWEGWETITWSSVPLEAPKASNFEGGVATLLYRMRNRVKDVSVALNGLSTMGIVEKTRGVKSISDSHIRQGRDVSYRLKARTFYASWTDLGNWI